MKKKNLVPTSLIGLASSSLAFLGAVSCCGFPILAAFLAWFGIGATQLRFLSTYQPLFTGIAIVALLYGFYSVYIRKGKSSNTSGCCEKDSEVEEISSSCCTPKPQANRFAKIMLWIGVFAVLATFFQAKESPLSDQEKTPCCTTNTEAVKKKSSCCSGTNIALPNTDNTTQNK